MTVWLKQSTAVTLVMGPFIDDTDGKTAEIALDITEQEVLLSKNGGAFTLKGDTTHGVHDAAHNGWYTIPLNTTDTNTLGCLTIAINMAGALPVWKECMVVAADAWDSLFGAVALGQAGAQAALVANNLDHLAKTATAAADMTTEVTDGTIISRMISNSDTSLFVPGTHSLQIVGADVAAVHVHAGAIETDVAAVHTHINTIDGHITADYGATEKSAIDLLDDAAGGLADIHTDVGTAITDIAAVHTHVGTIETDVAAVHTHANTIEADTNELQTDWANGGRLDLLLDGASAPSAATVADAVWDELKADHLTALTFGHVVGDTYYSTQNFSTMIEADGPVTRFTANALEQAPTGGSAPTAAQIRAEMDANSTQLAAIVADTAELQTDWANGGRLDLILDAAAVAAAGAGAIAWTYTLTNALTTLPIEGARVWVSTDSAALNIVASGVTNTAGQVTFYLDAGTVYVWRKKTGYNFTNPDTETVA